MSNIDDLIYISSPAIASLILSFIFKDIRIFYGGIIYSSTICVMFIFIPKNAYKLIK